MRICSSRIRAARLVRGPQAGAGAGGNTAGGGNDDDVVDADYKEV